jgi:hypothetical protein
MSERTKRLPLARRSAEFIAKLAIGLVVGFAASCDQSDDVSADFSGRYHVCLGPIERVVMDIACDGGGVTFTATGGMPVPVTGEGTIDGDRLSLAADIPDAGEFTMDVTSSDGGATFIGTSAITGPGRMEATVRGQHAPWPTFDLDLGNIPRLAAGDAIDLATVSRVSRFRSGEGHDYSDDFENCRSMKHYYFPKESVPLTSVCLYAPVSGTVIGTIEEYETPTVSKGRQVGIRPDGYPAFWVSIFHVTLDSPLAIGDHVAAGRLLGTSAKTSGTVTDVAFWVHTPSGDRLLSFFDCMTDSIFAIYHDRGVTDRAAPVIARMARDADPLTCDGELFEGPGNLPNWVELN